MKAEGQRQKVPAARRRKVSATVVKMMGADMGGKGGATMARRAKGEGQRHEGGGTEAEGPSGKKAEGQRYGGEDDGGCDGW